MNYSEKNDVKIEADRTLIIGCGALASEIIALKKLNGWSHIDLKCLDAALHNHPDLIAPSVDLEIKKYKKMYQKIFIAYADCGTAGALDEVLYSHKIERLSGAHCYETFSGEKNFENLMNEEVGTFFLTDFLVIHFDRLVYRGLGLDISEEIKKQIFGNYTRLIYLSQKNDSELLKKAKLAAKKLNLKFEHKNVGLAQLESQMERQILHFVH